MNFYNFIKELKDLNANVNILLSDPLLSNTAFSKIFASVPISQLKLPKGFEVINDRITNKHNSLDGSYINIEVEHISKNLNPLSPQKLHNTLVRETTHLNPDADWDFYSFFYEFKKLNPNLKLNVADVRYLSDAENVIYFTPTPEMDPKTPVILPEGFNFDVTRKGINNRASCKSGNYLNIKIQNTKKLDYDVSSSFMRKEDLFKAYAQSEKLKSIYNNLVPDIRSTTDPIVLISALKKLNPGIDFTFANPAISSDDSTIFYKNSKSSIINLPDGFYVDSKGNITNKHSSENGMYLSMTFTKQTKETELMCYTSKQLEKLIEQNNNQSLQKEI